MNDPAFWLLFAAVLAPVITGVVTMFLPRRLITTRVATALAGPALAIVILLSNGVSNTAHSRPFVEQLNLSFSFVTDPLGMFFALLIAGIGALIVLYARGYFGRNENDLARFYPMLGLFATAMLGLVLSDNFLALFLFWELTSISSFLLIGWDRNNPRAVRLALQALTVTGLGGMALLGGLCALGSATGAWSFSELAHVMHGGVELPNPGLLPLAFGLIVLGAGAKSAQWPLHFWLPGAMAAPTPVSAYLHSATMVKAGVYLFARLFPMLGASHEALAYWPMTLAGFGAITMLLGGYLALRADELKRIFAYTTVSQLGLLVCMYGVGAVQHHHETILSWPVMQILNHALYKAPLFIIAGAIMHIAGRKYLSQLSGLLKSHFHLALICLLACYAMAGGPLTLSFIAKETFLHQVYEAAQTNSVFWIVAAMTVLTAACNVAIFVRFLRTFLAPAHHGHAHDDHDHHHAHEHGFWGSCIWWPAAMIVAFQFIGGLVTPLFGSWISPVETHTGHFEHLPSIVYAFSHPGVPLYLSLAAIALGVVVGFAPIFRTTFADPHDRLFPATTRLGEVVGYRAFFTMQTGNLRTYLIMILAALVGALAWASSASGLLNWPRVTPLLGGDVGLVTAALFLTFLMCAAAMLIPWINSRVVRVLTLGACGFSVTGMYLVYQAPDLALTQLMFEIISIVLFLLVLRLLPEEPSESRPVARAPRLAFALVVGVSLGWIMLHSGAVADQSREAFLTAQAQSHDEHLAGPVVHDAALTAHAEQPDERLGAWFQRHAYKGSDATDGRGGGGTNVVNVVVVDFRGYDTLGEITVLGIAMMGVLAMLAGPAFIAEGGQERVLIPTRQPHLRSSLLRTSMPLILPLTLLFAGYVFFKGHNEPGGGFIAGLIASVGIVAYRMSEGPHALKRLIPLKPGVLVAIGLSFAAITAITPLLGGDSVLTLPHFNVPRLGSEPYHFTGAAFFDLGVMLVVIGCSTGIINRFEEELD
ncbi:MAG: DUF4040 domain-containing protein [Phycisphaerales bacterium]|nr:DUF4040 domain-containing protein [Phycisphaerales bacterium]